MTMEDNDLWRLAAILLQKHGQQAEVYARRKADEALENRNNRSCAAWRRIALAVSDLEQRADPLYSLH